MRQSRKRAWALSSVEDDEQIRASYLDENSFAVAAGVSFDAGRSAGGAGSDGSVELADPELVEQHA
jgi:hypothetical protein